MPLEDQGYVATPKAFRRTEQSVPVVNSTPRSADIKSSSSIYLLSVENVGAIVSMNGGNTILGSGGPQYDSCDASQTLGGTST